MNAIAAISLSLMLAAAPKLEGPYVRGKLAVYVVVGEVTDTRDYVTLEDGLASGAVVVREIGDGDVNSLQVENRSDKWLFLHVGDVIRGGKQDRTIATDVILPPKSNPSTVDAFCIERGRWSASAHSDHEFAASDAMVSGAGLKRSIQAERDQQSVWSGVAETITAVAQAPAAVAFLAPETGTYSAVVDAPELREQREEYVSALLPQLTKHADAVGLVAAVNGEIVGGDVYGSRELFEKLLPRILEAYAQEAVLSRVSGDSPAPAQEEAMRFLGEGAHARDEAISESMGRRTSENEDASIFEYRYHGDAKALHSSYVKKN